MPPQQCPECGRFLSRAFVAALDDAPAPCPKCAIELDPGRLGAESPEDLVATVVSDAPVPPPPVRDTPPPSATLADWDRDPAPVPAGAPAPPDAAIVAGAGVFGALIGMLVAGRRGRGGLLGLVAGIVAAAAARRVWELEDQG